VWHFKIFERLPFSFSRIAREVGNSFGRLLLNSFRLDSRMGDRGRTRSKSTLSIDKSTSGEKERSGASGHMELQTTSQSRSENLQKNEAPDGRGFGEAC
jgi:hypothetical protein